MKAIKFTLQLLGVIFLVSLVMAATLVSPGRKIRDYDRVTTLNDTHIFVVDDEGVANKNNSISWPNIRKITNGFAAITYVNNADTAVSNSLLSFISTNLVWTNNGGIIYPLALNGQATNSIQVYTNGGLSVGRSTLAYWVTPPGAGGEALVSVNNTVNGEIDFKEIFIGVTDTTNDYYFDFINQPSLTRAIWTLGSVLNMDFQIPDDGNLVFRARGTNGDYAWNFDPGSTSTLYALSSVRPVDASAQLLALQNTGTNKLTAWGTGKLTVESQITNNFLTASKIVLTDAGKGLVSSAFGESDLQSFSSTNYVNSSATNSVKVTSGTNILVVTNVSGNTITYQVNNTLDTNIFATTNYVASILLSNFVNFSVQAGKPIDSTNFPPISSGYKNWESLYYKTNIFGTAANLSQSWQFLVPPDYLTNTLQAYLTSMLLDTTNGPATSNTIFRISFFKSTPGDAVDVHQDAFGSKVSGTNTWTASNTGTNKTQSLLIDVSSVAPVQAGDLAILSLERNSTNDTYIGTLGLTGLQLWYKRKTQ